MDMIGKIRRLRRRGNKSEREIARMTGLSRSTVSKRLHGQLVGPPKYRRGTQPNKLTPFDEAFQFDWSEEGLVVGGIYCRAQVSHMRGGRKAAQLPHRLSEQ